MREIKFRAWDKTDKRMVGDIQKAYDGMSDDCLNGEYYSVSCFDDFLEDSIFIVMQFIGLRDNHGCGNEIYKGDTVRITQACGEEYIGEVVWDEDRLAWAVDSNDLDELMEFASIIHCEHLVEVIGNIYEGGDPA